MQKILKDPDVGILHIFGDRGIGKRTLIQCLAHELMSGESDFTRVFMSDLLSNPFVLEEWNADKCDWITYHELPNRSLVGALQVLFRDYSANRNDGSHAGDLTNGLQSTDHAENGEGNLHVQQNDEFVPDTPLQVENEKELHATKAEDADDTANLGEPRDEAKTASGKELRRKRVLVVLRDYADPSLQKPIIEKPAITMIQNLMKQKRLLLILVSEANLLDRSYNVSQRLEAYRTLFYTTRGWQFKVGLLSTEDATKCAIGLSFQRSAVGSGQAHPPTNNQVCAILQAAGPHPGQIDQAVVSLGSHKDDESLGQFLVNKLLQGNKAIYEAIWNGLQQREKSVLLTYGLMKRNKLTRANAQTILAQQIEDFYATDTDFRDVEKNVVILGVESVSVYCHGLPKAKIDSFARHLVSLLSRSCPRSRHIIQFPPGEYMCEHLLFFSSRYLLVWLWVL
ncbi:MAG: hypothetical protein HZY76_22910 [Anaerolineae bacterium]|nr:MAG: hypothetical protein HZY76_22910 [Anaerolineae bacterium]